MSKDQDTIYMIVPKRTKMMLKLIAARKRTSMTQLLINWVDEQWDQAKMDDFLARRKT